MCLANEKDSREKKLAVRKLKREGATRTTDQESSHKSAFSPDSATTSRRLPSTVQSRSQKGGDKEKEGAKAGTVAAHLTSWRSSFCFGREGPLSQSSGVGRG